MSCPKEEPIVDPNKSAGRYDRDNKQCRWSPRGLANVYPSKHLQRTDNIRTDLSTSIGKWECVVCGFEPWRRPTKTPHADYDGCRVQGTNRIRVCAAAQPRQLPTKHGERPRTSAWNWKISDKTKHCFKNTPPWTEPLKIRSSRR